MKADKEARASRIATELKNLAGLFLKEVSDRSTLITITNIRVTPDAKNATLYFTVLPEDKENVALKFINRKKREFCDFVKSNSKIGRMPRIFFMIDEGEKNRIRIEEITKEL